MTDYISLSIKLLLIKHFLTSKFERSKKNRAKWRGSYLFQLVFRNELMRLTARNVEFGSCLVIGSSG